MICMFKFRLSIQIWKTSYYSNLIDTGPFRNNQCMVKQFTNWTSWSTMTSYWVLTLCAQRNLIKEQVQGYSSLTDGKKNFKGEGLLVLNSKYICTYDSCFVSELWCKSRKRRMVSFEKGNVMKGTKKNNLRKWTF